MSVDHALKATVVEIISGVLDEPATALEAEPTLAAHDWDSLATLEALAQLESRLGVTLDLRSYHAARTVDDLVRLVSAARVKNVASTNR